MSGRKRRKRELADNQSKEYSYTDKVSVIVPIYNSEKYLMACLESIVNQTYKNLEIILVDDGSTDDSGRICDEYAKRDARVKVIHKANGGNGNARNAGLECASGEWLVWVDNDDIIHKQQIEILLSAAKKQNLDIAVGGYYAIDDDEVPEDKNIDNHLHEAEVITDEHLYNDEFIKKRSMIFTVPWGKICKRELYNGIKFPARSRNDDTWTTWKVYERVNKVGLLDETLYYWRNNPNSFGRVFDASHLNGIDAYKEQLEYFRSAKKQRYVEIVYAEYTESFFWCYNRMREHNMDLSALKPYWEYMRKSVRYIKLTRSMGLYMWLKYRYLVYYRIPKLIK